jgi:hypothetical protein
MAHRAGCSRWGLGTHAVGTRGGGGVGGNHLAVQAGVQNPILRRRRGELECGAAGNGVITGSLKIMGYAQSELLTATDP